MELRSHLQDILSNNHLVQLATAGPWICTVFCVADEQANLYWLSLSETRHSQTLEQDERCAVAVLAQARPQIGLQAEGRAVRLAGSDLLAGLEIYGAFTHKDAAWRQAIIDGDNPHQLYRFTAASWQLYDVAHFPDKPKQEIIL